MSVIGKLQHSNHALYFRKIANNLSHFLCQTIAKSLSCQRERERGFIEHVE